MVANGSTCCFTLQTCWEVRIFSRCWSWMLLMKYWSICLEHWTNHTPNCSGLAGEFAAAVKIQVALHRTNLCIPKCHLGVLNVKGHSCQFLVFCLTFPFSRSGKSIYLFHFIIDNFAKCNTWQNRTGSIWVIFNTVASLNAIFLFFFLQLQHSQNNLLRLWPLSTSWMFSLLIIILKY